MPIESVNPATGEPSSSTRNDAAAEAAAVAKAHDAWKAWRKTTFAERATPMKKAAEILRERKDEFARLMALEMGKPLKQGVAEAEKCALGCDYYADHAEAHLAPEPVKTDASKSYVAFDPLGVVLAVMPWNFPFWQVFRFAAPALMAGNAGVLKHASNVPGCALAIEEHLQGSRISRRRVPHAADRQQTGEGGDRTSARARRDTDGQHARGQSRGGAGWRGDQEDSARARRVRSVYRPRRRGPRTGGEYVRHVAADQFRTELRQRKALHRR